MCVCAGKNVYMLASTVSSKFLQRMASIEGFQFEVCVYIYNLSLHGMYTVYIAVLRFLSEATYKPAV